MAALAAAYALGVASAFLGSVIACLILGCLWRGKDPR